MELAARRVPYILWGPGIHPGDLGTFPQRDSASTLSALMGLPPPIMAAGLPHLDAFDISEKKRASVMLDLLEQRSRRWRAARTDWPWLKVDPAAPLKAARALWSSKDYAGAASAARRAVDAVDRELEEHSPGQWAGRLTWILWLLVLAASCGAAWPQARRAVRASAAVLGVLGAGLLASPLLVHSIWPLAVAWGLAAAAALLLLSLASGLESPALSWLGWSAWWAMLAALAFPNLVDVSLWSWAALLLVLAMRLRRLEPGDIQPAAWVLTALAVCAFMNGWTAGAEMSALRYHLPKLDLRRFGAAPWRMGEFWAVLALTSVLWQRLRAGLGWIAAARDCAWAVAPIALALLPWPAALRHWVWTACLVSLAAAWRSPLPRQVKALWLSLLGLAFCRTQSSGGEACLLALAALTGWNWAELRPLAAPLWQGLGLVGLCLWAYVLPGGRLDFSHISVAEAYSGLGKSWTPHLLAVLVALKPAAFLVTPIVPLLAATPASALPGAIALLGSLAAGSLTLLWFDKFYFKIPMSSLVDTAWYERLLMGAILTWLLLLAWTGVQAFMRGRSSCAGAPAGSREAPRRRWSGSR
jgi:hypothetical protein